MAIYKRGVIPPWLPFLGVEILTTFWFLWHNFLSRYARNQSRALKTRRKAYFLEKYLGQNVGPFDGRPGPGKVGHKNAKTPHL